MKIGPVTGGGWGIQMRTNLTLVLKVSHDPDLVQVTILPFQKVKCLIEMYWRIDHIFLTYFLHLISKISLPE